jgi:hypothetical protein
MLSKATRSRKDWRAGPNAAEAVPESWASQHEMCSNATPYNPQVVGVEEDFYEDS